MTGLQSVLVLVLFLCLGHTQDLTASIQLDTITLKVLCLESTPPVSAKAL
jgi:hypothetical protein